MVEQIIEYIKKQKQNGFSEKLIKEALLKAGYNEIDVRKAFHEATVFHNVNFTFLLLGIAFLLLLIFYSVSLQKPGLERPAVIAGFENEINECNNKIEDIEKRDKVSFSSDFCVNEVLRTNAVELKNEKLCLKINNVDERIYCSVLVNKNIDLCENIRNSELKNKCIRS